MRATIVDRPGEDHRFEAVFRVALVRKLDPDVAERLRREARQLHARRRQARCQERHREDRRGRGRGSRGDSVPGPIGQATGLFDGCRLLGREGISGDPVGERKGLLREEPVGAVISDQPLAQVGDERSGQDEKGIDDQGQLDRGPRILRPVDDRRQHRHADQGKMRREAPGIGRHVGDRHRDEEVEGSVGLAEHGDGPGCLHRRKRSDQVKPPRIHPLPRKSQADETGCKPGKGREVRVRLRRRLEEQRARDREQRGSDDPEPPEGSVPASQG